MATSSTQENGDEGTDVAEWVDVQKKTFTDWVNEKLKGTPRKVEVLEDLDDGVTLIKLLETLANKKMQRRYYSSQHSTPLPQQYLMPCWTILHGPATASHPITPFHEFYIFCSIFLYIPPSSHFFCSLSHVPNSIILSHIFLLYLSDIVLSLSTSSIRAKIFR